MVKYPAAYCLLFVVLATQVGCGFHLKGMTQAGDTAPAAAVHWQIAGNDDFAAILQDVIEDYAPQAADDAPHYQVQIIQSLYDKSMVNINRQGSVNEYLLRYRIKVAVKNLETGHEFPAITLSDTRPLYVSFANVLGKDAEEALIKETMQRHLAEKLWFELVAHLENASL